MNTLTIAAIVTGGYFLLKKKPAAAAPAAIKPAGSGSMSEAVQLSPTAGVINTPDAQIIVKTGQHVPLLPGQLDFLQELAQTNPGFVAEIVDMAAKNGGNPYDVYLALTY